jgi:hypothetical protein
MQARHQLMASVLVVAAVIFVAWFTLFRNDMLVPPSVDPDAPTLAEIAEQFDQQREDFEAQFDLAPPIGAATPAATLPPLTAP